MRLTLRTLLAWMDGVLPAADAGHLGEKVSGSAVAQTLASRIRDIIARPTIAAAAPEGRGLAADANSAAEFLDNVLPAERLAEFERVCIESDMQLAEVADCHRLLADLTTGRASTGDLDPALGERLRSLATAARVAVAAESDVHAAAASGRRAERDVATPDTVLVSPTPAERSRATRARPARAWLLAGSAAGVLVVLLGLLAWSLAGGERRQVAVRAPAAAEAPPAVESGADQPAHAAAAVESPPLPMAPAAEPPPGVAIEPPVATRESPDAVVTTPQPAATLDESAAGAAAPPASPDRQTVESGPPPAPIADRVPQGEALAIAAPMTSAVPAPQRPAANEPEPPVAAAEPAAAVVAGPFVLLVGVAGAPEQPMVWQARRATDSITLPAELLSSPFSQPELAIGRLRIRLLPSTRAAIVTDSDGGVRLEVLFGRAVVVTDDPTARLGVTAAGLVGRVRGGLDAPVGVEVVLVREPGSDPATVPATRRARLVSAGGIAWEQTADDGGPPAQPLQGFDPDGRIPAGGAVAWSSLRTDAAVVTPPAAIPGWLAGTPEVEAADRQAALGLVTRLPAAGPVQPALRQLAVDPRGEQRVLAAATLALLGDYDEAVRQLSAEDQGRGLYAGQWAKLESLTVPLALARGANAAARFTKALADQGPPGTAETLARLARGFAPADLEAGADAWLVEALEDSHLVVRRYAFQRLTELTSPTAVDRLRYRPDGRPEQRREGVEWWRRQQREGRLRGAVPPSP